MLESKDWRELTTNGFAKISVFHWWQTNNSRREHGILTVCDGCNVEDRILSSEGIESEVVTEWPFSACFTWNTIPFNHDVCLCRYHQVLAHSFRDTQRASAEDSSKLVFAQIIREWSNSREDEFWGAAYADGYRHSLSACSSMICSMFVDLPMQTDVLLIEDLSTVHAKIVITCFRIFGDNQRQGYEMTSIHWPCFWNREFGQIWILHANLLTRSGKSLLSWRHSKCVTGKRKRLPWHLYERTNVWFHHRCHTVANFGFMRSSECVQCSLMATKQVHDEWHG